jgi:tellurite resistance protein
MMSKKRKLPRGGGTQVALSPELAIAAIGLFSEFADGESTGATGDAEDAAFGEMLSAIDLYEDYSEDDFAALGTEIGTLINEEGIDAVVAQAIATAKEEGLEEAAFAVAVYVVAADGEVPESEQEYIDSLYQALGLSEERANEIIDELFSDDEADEEEEDA